MLLFRKTYTKQSLLLYVLLSAPSVIIELFFERNSRPKYNGSELRNSGEDLEAKGLTEWMWDILYWTWACIVLAAVIGDRAWYLYVRTGLGLIHEGHNYADFMTARSTNIFSMAGL